MNNELSFQQSYDELVIIWDGIETLRSSFNNSPIEEIRLPSSLTLIDHCFQFCTNLKKVVFVDGMNPDLQIKGGSFDFVFYAETAAQLLDFEAPDLIKTYIFTAFRLPQMKRTVLFAYLSGKPASGKFEEAILRYAKKDFENLVLYFCYSNDADLFQKYLKLFKPDKKTHELLIAAMETAKERKAVSIETAISDYLAAHYGADESNKLKGDAKLKKLGLKERSIADWKKIFKLRETEHGYVIVKYLADETEVEVPEIIGKKPVVAIDAEAFKKCNVTSIESPVSPHLSDFFYCQAYPSLNVYGHSELTKKIRTVDLKTAEVNQFVLFGSYPSDSEDSTRKPIVWRVINKEGNRLMLASRYDIEGLPMHSTREQSTWEGCGLRRWLNELFYNFAFTDEEKKMILKTKLVNSKNPEFGTPSGKDTEDYVFLLSCEEAESLKSTANVWCKESTNYSNAGYIWYRTNGRYKTYFAAQFYYGGFGCDENHGVRPVIWVQIDE